MRKRERFKSLLLAAVLALGLCAGAVGLNAAASAETTAEGDHRTAYYVQCQKVYGTENKVPFSSLPSTVGIKTMPANQYNTNNRFNNSGNDTPQQYALHPEAVDGGYNGDGKLWGLYFDPDETGVQHDTYGSVLVAEGDPLYDTPFGTVVSGGNQNVDANARPLTYKFELPDTTTAYDVVIGVHAGSMASVWWGDGTERTAEVFVNGSATAAAAYDKMHVAQYVELHNIKAVSEEVAPGDTRPILTLKLAPKSGRGGPAVSFIAIAESGAPQPAYLSNTASVINVGVKDELPSKVTVLTTAGEKQVDVTYTDRSAFDKAENKFLLNTVRVAAIADVFGVDVPITVPVQFINKAGVQYYLNCVNDKGQTRVTEQTFAAMRAVNAATMKNDVMSADSDGESWGVIASTRKYTDWIASTLYNDDPYRSVYAGADGTGATIDGVEYLKSLQFKFPDLPAGDYAVTIGGCDIPGYGARSADVFFNGVKAGAVNTSEHVNISNSLRLTLEQPGALDLCLRTATGDIFVGFIVITAFQPEDYYGDDADQTYFFNCGDGSSAHVDGIGRPAYQSTMHRDFNAVSGGAPSPDITGKHWGLYYNDDMTAGYYAAASKGSGSPFDTMVYTNIDAAERAIVFKFELDDTSIKYDVVVGYECAWGGGNGDHRAGQVFINDDARAAASFVNQSYRGAAVIEGVCAAATDSDTGLANILTVRVAKHVGGTEPIVSFVSVRPSDKAPVFLAPGQTGGAIALNEGVDALPQTAEYLTTAGYAKAPIEYTDTTALEDAANKQIMNTVEVEGRITVEENAYDVVVPVTFILKEDVYYFANLTAVEESGLFYQPPHAQTVFEAVRAANAGMINDVPDAIAAGDGWGCVSQQTECYWGYERDFYQSVKQGTDLAGGAYHLTYRFPSLPAGKYLVQIGVRDPWGPRTSDVTVNGKSVGSMRTQTNKNVLTSMLFSQGADGAPVTLDLAGKDGQMASFIIIRKIDDRANAQSVAIHTHANNYFFVAGQTLDVSGMTLMVTMEGYEYVTPVELSMVSGYDADKIGEQSITVTYMGQSVTYKVTVTKPVEEGGAEPGGGVPGWGVAAATVGALLLCAGLVLLYLVKAGILRRKK